MAIRSRAFARTIIVVVEEPTHMEPRTILPAIAILVSIFTFGLSFWFTWRSSIAAKRPVLVFVYEDSIGWLLRNIGGGPALNVIVAQKRIGGEWFNPVRVPPFAKDAEMSLRWLGHANTTGLGATYTDYEDRPYTSTCGDDLSRTFRGARFGPWPKEMVGRYWSQADYQE
jgi:hypothetical protein